MKFIAFAILLVVAVVFAAQFLKMQTTKPPSMPEPVFKAAPASDDHVLSTRELTVYADTLFPIQYTGGPVAVQGQRLAELAMALHNLPADHPNRKSVQSDYDDALAKVAAYNKANDAHQKQVAGWVLHHEGITGAQILKETSAKKAPRCAPVEYTRPQLHSLDCAAPRRNYRHPNAENAF